MSSPWRRVSMRSGVGPDWRCLARRRGHYDDFDDDEIDLGRPAERPYQNPTTLGMIGFVFSGLSLGLLVVVFILWIFLRHDNQGQIVQNQVDERTRWMMYWFLILDVLSFFAGLTATIMGGRGMAPSNPLYRGYSTAALILGIVEMVATIIFGFIMTCVVLIFEALRVGG
jgi:hypothetical protein